MVKPDFDVTFINTREAVLRYTIQGFSDICGPEVSPPCYLLNLPWRILIMPWAIQDDDMRWTKRYMSYFLQSTMDKRYRNWFCNVIGELDLLSVSEESEPFRRKINHKFSSNDDNYGYNCYILWNDILDPDKGFIKDDAITLQVHLVIEEPESGSIWYNMRDFTGRIYIPKKKRQTLQELNESNCLLDREDSVRKKREPNSALRKFKELFTIRESPEKI